MTDEEIKENRHYVVSYLHEHGFEVVDKTGKYPDEQFSFYLRGELVGWSYNTVLYLEKNMPSLSNMKALPVLGKSTVVFDIPFEYMKDRLIHAVDLLKKSADKYEEIVKIYRSEQVKRYFKVKRLRESFRNKLREKSVKEIML